MVAVPVVAPVVPEMTAVANATKFIWPLLPAEFVGTKYRLYCVPAVSPVIVAVLGLPAFKTKALPPNTAM